MSASDGDALIAAAFADGATDVSISQRSVGPHAFAATISAARMDGGTFMFASAHGSGATWQDALRDALRTAKVPHVASQIDAPQQRIAIAGKTQRERLGWRERLRRGGR